MIEKDLQYFTIEAPTPREALEQMRRQYGQEARILTHKTVRAEGSSVCSPGREWR